MSSAERALLNAPRQSSLSSQMAAITAAADRDESPSPPSGACSKGKLDQMKIEPQIKQEDETDIQHDTSGGGYGGKNIKNEMNSVDIKQEIKTEPMEENGVIIKEEPGLIKEEPGLQEASADIKPTVDVNNAVGAGERKHKSK